MRRLLILFVSLGLNLVLIWLLLSARRHALPGKTPVVEAPADTNAARTHVVVRKQFFSWEELESPDYQVYVKNLRDIDCPELTIRDIIVADVNQLYAWKRLTEVTAPEQQWWLTTPDTNLVFAAAAKRLALDQERRATLTALLGTNWEAAAAPLNSFVSLTGPVLGDLSPAAKRAVMAILARAEQRTQTYLDTQANAGLPTDPAAMARLEKQLRGELAQALTPEQYEEYLLRNSDTAANLRGNLRGISVTPDEFRNLFRVIDPLQQQMDLASADPQADSAQLPAMEKKYYDALQKVLGPARYEEFRMAKDPVFRDAVNAATEAGASQAAADQLYQVKKSSLDEENRILNDDTLTKAQKADKLKLLEQQEQIASDQILGLTPPAPIPVAAAPPPTPPLPPAAVHAYSPGETLDQIATLYGVSANAILNANPNLNFNQLDRGASINIPKPPSQ